MSGFKERLKARAEGLKRDIPAVFMALKHKDTPWTAKVFAALAVVYALSPVDLIPDFIPVLGYLDDLILLPALVAAALKRIPPEVLAECRAESEARWASVGKGKRWLCALPILALWLLILWLIVKAIRL